MIHESEIDYNLTLVKNTRLEMDKMSSMYSKALDTLELLMCKLGLKEAF
jgi:hypothetical protein